nr:hypothetical protein [Mycobacterium pseudoshottsii]
MLAGLGSGVAGRAPGVPGTLGWTHPVAAAISWFMWFMSPSSPSTHVRRRRRW